MYGLAIVCVVTLPIFAWIEKKAVEPILPLNLITRAQPCLVLMGFAFTTSANFARVSPHHRRTIADGHVKLYMQPVYLRVSRGLNGSQTGLLLLPSSIVGSASSLYAGWHMRVRPLIVCGGFLMWI